MKNKLFVLVFAGVSVLGVRAYAHHSFASTYLEDQKMTIEADVLQFLYRNPHSFLQLQTKDAKGTATIAKGAGRTRKCRNACCFERHLLPSVTFVPYA